MKKVLIVLGLLIAVNFSAISQSQSVYTLSEMDDATRRSLDPAEWVSELPDSTPFTTPSITLNTPTPVKIPTLPLFATDWEVHDLGGGDLVVRYVGLRTDARFRLTMTTSISAPGANTLIVKVHVRRNDTDTIRGSLIKRSIGVGDDTGAISISAEAEVSTNDWLRIFMETTKTTAFLYENTSIIIKEVN